MYTGPERRRSPRKKVHLPVQIIAAGQTVATGFVLNINSSGVNIDVLLELAKGEITLAELLSVKEVRLVIGQPENRELYIEVSAEIKWELYHSDTASKVCLAGLELILPDENQLIKWQEYYNSI